MAWDAGVALDELLGADGALFHDKKGRPVQVPAPLAPLADTHGHLTHFRRHDPAVALARAALVGVRMLVVPLDPTDDAHDAPAAIRFSSGILCAHGGAPHADLLSRLVTAADLCAPECARDFLWCRVSDARRKFPNRSARDCELGRDDILGFLGRLDQLPAAGGGPVSPVRLFVRGHDHARDGHASMSLGEGRGTVHTVTTFRDEEDDFFGPQRATLLILPDNPASGEPEIVPVPEKEDCP